MLNIENVLNSINIPILTLLLNLLIGGFASFFLAWHYIHFGRTLANRKEFAWILPFICLTTILIISIIKSSLALSLGMVGALSIVRFRTPIKEPEELAYLFMSIALGIGLGADQRLPTIIAYIFTIAILTFRANLFKYNKSQSHYLNIEIPEKYSQSDLIKKIDDLLKKYSDISEIKRIDVREGLTLMTYFIDCKNKENLFEAMNSLKSQFPEASISFIQHSNIQAL